MKAESLTKTLGLLVGVEWGVGVEFSPPFICGKLKSNRFKIHCEAVNHVNGTIPRVLTDTDTTNLMVLILNKSGNNLVMLSSKTSKKLSAGELTMREMSEGIIYKNEIEL
tara:strand:- start:23088 stop:23417 length:330 start_codon:yes stop_codon:yes gene_type:complete